MRDNCRPILALLAFVVASQLPTDAHAWKPTTHAYLADLAVQDALDDGIVTIEVLGASQKLSYPVDAEVLDALRRARAHYRAGVLGPDAYPDIATGQMSIHPDPRESGVPEGANAWLMHVWNEFGATPQERAFRLGFLTHAAGDMYGHTFINHFTGAPFTMNPPQNAIKHVVLEGYVDKRIPTQAIDGDFFSASIAGLERKIYSAMIDAQPGTVLDRNLLKPDSAGGRYSVPRIFSTLRADIKRDIDRYYARKSDLVRRIEDCELLDFSCSRVVLIAELTAHVTANALPTTYKEYWRADIDEGLRAWPEVSHSVAKALFFSPQRTADVDAADQILTDYVQRHLLSMAGAPDFVGLSAQALSAIIEGVTPDFLFEPLRKLKEELLNTLLVSAIGMDKQQLKDYVTRPDRYFDEVMNTGAGEHVTLARFNSDYLKLSDSAYSDPSQAFDYRQVPAAYNTVVLSKLILLARPVIDKLITDLGSDVKLDAPNVMLGFIRTLDGSTQWRAGFLLARGCAVYDKIFMPLPGGGGCQGG